MHEPDINDLFTVALASLDMAQARPTSLRIQRAAVLVDLWLECAAPLLEDCELGERIELDRQLSAILQAQVRLATQLVAETEGPGDTAE